MNNSRTQPNGGDGAGGAMVLFASYFRPEFLQVLPLAEALALSCRVGVRQAEAYFGIYPFSLAAWLGGRLRALLRGANPILQIAPVLERLVFPDPRASVGLDP